MNHLTSLDMIALGWYLTFWLGFAYISDRSALRDRNLSHLMNQHRIKWMRIMSTRELRIVDTSIITGLQNGTAFFASTALLAIGAGFALLNKTDLFLQLSQDLALPVTPAKELWELKILMLISIYVYAFFKFGWAYRLFNYASILMGAFPLPGSVSRDEMEEAIHQAGEINILAGKHFSLGLRAFFFSLALFGWFIHPILFIATTTFIGLVLIRRQFFSRSQAIAKRRLP